MTSLLAGTLDHGVRGSREVSESQNTVYLRNSPELPGTLRNYPVVVLGLSLYLC